MFIVLSGSKQVSFLVFIADLWNFNICGDGSYVPSNMVVILTPTIIMFYFDTSCTNNTCNWLCPGIFSSLLSSCDC